MWVVALSIGFLGKYTSDQLLTKSNCNEHQITTVIIPVSKLSPRIALGQEIIEPEAEVGDTEVICSGSVYEQSCLLRICLSKHLSKH